MKTIRTLTMTFASLALAVASASTFAQSSPRVGAVGQFEKDGVPKSGLIPLPDCRGCKVTQTGPNHYTIQIPDATRQKLGMPPAKK